MKRNLIHNQKGMGFFELAIWAGLIGLIGWAAWQWYLHPENRQSRAVSHNAYEDSQPPTP
jgi:hypothetical protein